MECRGKVYFFMCISLFIISGNCGANSEGNGIEKALSRNFKRYFETGHLGEFIRNTAQDLELKNLFKESLNEPSWNEKQVDLFCSMCATAVNEILKIGNKQFIVDNAIKICIELEMATPQICTTMVHANEEEVFYIIDNTSDVTGNDICGVIFVSKGCTSRNPDRVWEVQFPDVPKPPIHESPYPSPDVPTMKVLHLADTHYDPDYTPGASVTCEEEYLCCRKHETPTDPNNGAGYWGNYGNCDIPRWTLEAVLEHAVSTHPDIDFVLWTGDVIPHSVWESDRKGNLEIIHDTANLISEHLPNVPVYPALGNHDGDPVNQFAQPYISDPEFDISWLYDELQDIWGRWLTEDAANSVGISAYYSVQVRPGLRILSINTNYCNGFNWWLIHDSSDIANELGLAVQELQMAEDQGEKVYIIGHIPSGSGDCQLTWSHEFNKVVLRYESTISGIFFSHTHKDHIQLFMDPQNSTRAYEVAYLGPSQTTYSNLNPGYRIFTIEGQYKGSEFRVLDHETWIMDLNIANALKQPIFFKLYSAKKEYGLDDLSPSSWFNLIKEMNTANNTLFDKYYRNYVKAGLPYLIDGCSDSCKSYILCSALLSDNSNHSTCDVLHETK